MSKTKSASTAIATLEETPTPATPPQQPAPWFITRDEQIRLKALELAVQTTGSVNKVEVARSYMRFLKPEEDVVA